MTDRYDALTVILDHDIRADDADGIISAIGMVRGVQQVLPHVMDANTAIAENRARHELTRKLWEALCTGKTEEKK
jgi:hypothetical protein